MNSNTKQNPAMSQQIEEIAKMLGMAGMKKEQESYLAGIIAGMQFEAAARAEREQGAQSA